MNPDVLDQIDELFRDLMFTALDAAHHFNILPKAEYVDIPELSMEADDITGRLYQEFAGSFFQSNPEATEEQMHLVLGRFCICAGVGAVVHWHKDFSELKQKGLYETLTAEKGLVGMDEYVADLMGMPYETEKAQKFMSSCQAVSMILHKEAFDGLDEIIPGAKDNPERFSPFIIMECFKILYKLGILIGLQRIVKGLECDENATEEEIGVVVPVQFGIIESNGEYRDVRDGKCIITVDDLRTLKKMIDEYEDDDYDDMEICDYDIKEYDEELYNRILKSVEELSSFDKNEYEDGHFAYVITLSKEMFEEYLSDSE